MNGYSNSRSTAVGGDFTSTTSIARTTSITRTTSGARPFLLQIALGVLLLAPPTAGAQNWLLAPAYGEVELFAGFTEDPYVVDLVAGGAVDLANRGYRGQVADAPDFDLWYEAGSFPLTIRVERGTGATILLVNDPSGHWHFNDGSDRGDPQIVFRRPESGLYNIWVGTLRAGFVPARLVITEY